MKKSDPFLEGIEYLKNKNQKISDIIECIGIIDFKKRDLNFESLIKIIIGQQLSGRVATIIFERLKELNTKTGLLKPDFILNLSDGSLRGIGISSPKIKYIRNLSELHIEHPNIIQKWLELDDKDAYVEIQKLRGFGPWSASIILLFYFGRLDIFPIGDVTLQKTYFNIFGNEIDMELKEIEWARPFRSILAIYLWKYYDKN